jgi:inorganic pyrophosphatase
MNIEKIPIGKNPPQDVNVIVEVPLRSDPVKYEFDKDSGAIFVDRFIGTMMMYPCNYGFIPHTLAEDGDPVDVLVAGRIPVLPGSVMRSRPIAVLRMTDEAGRDDKILAVPHAKVSQYWTQVNSHRDLPSIEVDRIVHFFEHYKDLEEGKWVKVEGWGDAEEAARIILAGVERYRGGS